MNFCTSNDTVENISIMSSDEDEDFKQEPIKTSEETEFEDIVELDEGPVDL